MFGSPTSNPRDLRLVREDEHVALYVRGELLLRVTAGEWSRMLASPEYPKTPKPAAVA